MTTKSAKNDLTTISKAIGLPGKFTRTSWVPPDNLTYPEWLAAGRRIMDVRMATSWWVGDWWRSQEAYGQRVAIAREHLSLELETIRNYASVAARVSYRNETLTFTHHMPVAHMPPDSQRKWLEYAIEHSLSAKELRAEIEKAEALASQTHDSDASEDAASEISHPIDTENHELTQSAELPEFGEGPSFGGGITPPLPPPVRGPTPEQRDRGLLVTFTQGAGSLYFLINEPLQIFEGTKVVAVTPALSRTLFGTRGRRHRGPGPGARVHQRRGKGEQHVAMKLRSAAVLPTSS